MPGSIYIALTEVANEQHGFITPDDARELGINPINLVRMAERGQLERRGNSVYRFPLFPPGRLDPYMEATLWPRGVEGVLSHETALDLFELSDVHPGKIHITVPQAHRIRRNSPAQYRIHREDLPREQVTRYEGIPIVTPAHAIYQTYHTHLSPALIAQAIDHGERNGRLTLRQANGLRREMSLPPGEGARR
jgi:predicted transcriptional regulator of viral defense system